MAQSPLRSQRAKLIRANLYERPTAKDKLAIQISIDTVAVHVVELSVTGTKTEVGRCRPGISSAAHDKGRIPTPSSVWQMVCTWKRRNELRWLPPLSSQAERPRLRCQAHAWQRLLSR